LRSKGLYFSIERFGRSIRTSIVKVVEYVFVMNSHSSGNGVEAFKFSLPYLFIPFSQTY
jgi:hypothetical protein